MKMKLTKFLSLALALIMLLSAAPISASAATYLNFDNSEVVPPTVTPTEFDYGLTYGDLKIEGGSLSYNGEKLEGYWGVEDWMRDTKINPSDEYYVDLSFFPTDTNYAVSWFYPTTEEQMTGWPVVKVNALEAKVDGAVTATDITVGDRLSKSTITGKVVDSEGNEITSGKWTWVSDKTKGGSSWKVYISDTFNAQWKCKGYTTLVVPVSVNAIAGSVAATGTVEKPTVTENLVYFEGMTLADIPLVGGKAIYEGKEIAGHFEWSLPQRAVTPEKTVQTQIKFIPDDSAIAATWPSESLTCSYKVLLNPIKTPLEITKTPESLSFTVGTTETSAKASAQGFEFGEGIDASKVMLKWEGSLKELAPGTYEARDITVYVDDTLSNYEEKTVSLPIVIKKRQDTGTFCFIDLTRLNSNNEGKVSISFSYHSQYKTGTATIKLNDMVMAEGVGPTYNPGEKSKTLVYEYTIPEPGTYTFVATAEYFPGEGDTVEFTNPVVESHPLTITVKPWRKLTLVNAKTESFETYEGRELHISTSLKTDDFKCWEFTDASGNVIPPETFGLTAEDMEKTTLAFKMIDQDITLTAKEKKLINIPTLPDNPGGDDDGELTFWQKIVNFFKGIFEGICNSDCILVNWICKLWKLIVGAFTAVFNLITGK